MTGSRVELAQRLRKLADENDNFSDGSRKATAEIKLLRDAADALESPTVALAGERQEPPPDALTALRELREAALDAFGDPEDCEDCLAIADSGEADGCRLHIDTKVAKRLHDAVCGAEDALGPCDCGHPRNHHDEDEARPCRVCSCRNFKLTALAAAAAPLTPPPDEQRLHDLADQLENNAAAGTALRAKEKQEMDLEHQTLGTRLNDAIVEAFESLDSIEQSLDAADPNDARAGVATLLGELLEVQLLASKVTPVFSIEGRPSAAAALAGERQEPPPRLFPIQRGAAIPWAVIGPFDGQCKINHCGQDLEKIASRGGLSAKEAIHVLRGVEWRGKEHARILAQTNEQDTLELVAIVRDREAAAAAPLTPQQMLTCVCGHRHGEHVPLKNLGVGACKWDGCDCKMFGSEAAPLTRETPALPWLTDAVAFAAFQAAEMTLAHGTEPTSTGRQREAMNALRAALEAAARGLSRPAAAREPM